MVILDGGGGMQLALANTYSKSKQMGVPIFFRMYNTKRDTLSGFFLSKLHDYPFLCIDKLFLVCPT